MPMTREKLEHFADVIVSKYTPQSKGAAHHEIKSSVFEMKLGEVRALIIDFPSDLSMMIKEQVAENALAKLKDAYMCHVI